LFRFLAVCALAVAGVTAIGTPVHAAGNTSHPHATANTWSQHDTAVYVVSTLNLVRTRNGHPVTILLEHKFQVSKYAVLGDAKVPDLYFVELKRDDGSTFGVYAYQMGWARPFAITASVAHYGVKLAAQDIVNAYKSDTKPLIGTFDSTLPQ
jgi:hypothetical protein